MLDQSIEASLWSAVYLEEREGPSVAREPQAQHALQLGDGDMEGSSTGEGLNDWLWQVGGQEAQLKPTHAELWHKTSTKHRELCRSVTVFTNRYIWRPFCVIISFCDFWTLCVCLYHDNPWEECYGRGHSDPLGLEVRRLRRTGVQSQRTGNQLLHHGAGHQTNHRKGTWEMIHHLSTRGLTVGFPNACMR